MESKWEAKNSIAVLGGAVQYSEAQIIAAFQIGREVANQGKNLVTGGTTGIPYAAAIGAKSGGATVVGISPAANVEEHVRKYRKPLSCLDVIVYTGMGLEGRNPINVRSVKGAIFVGGEFGTLGEFSAAYTCGNNVLGVLDGMGGVSNHIRDILATTQSQYGSQVIFESDPINLARRVCTEVDLRFPTTTFHSTCEQIGSDVREIINRFLDMENSALCKTRPASIPIGV
jgi:uncharacterized protein (TIGR00725 family)